MSRIIPQCNPSAASRAHAPQIEDAVRRVIDNGRYILGPEVLAFEQEFAAYVGARYAIGVANGTDALSLSLQAVGVQRGDVVITSSHTAVATAVAIRAAGACPLFADVDAETGLISPVAIEALLKSASRGELPFPPDKITALVPVHLYGRSADMDTITSLADRYGLVVVEDCAQAHGAFANGGRVGSLGRAGAFSFYPTKNLGAIGDAGILVTSSSDVYERASLLRQYGWKERYVSQIEGVNSRLDEIQAAILRVKLPHLDADNLARRRVADLYSATIRSSLVELPPPAGDGEHVFHQFAVRAAKRDSLQRHLAELGVGTLVHYPVPVHLQPAYSEPAWAPHPLPQTERWAREVLSLPMFPQLDLGDAEYVAACVNSFGG